MAINPEEGTIKSRKVAILVADGVNKKSVDLMRNALQKEGAHAVLISTHVGNLKYNDGSEELVQFSYLTEASVCYDACYTPDGDSIAVLSQEPDYFQFINEAFRHCKALAFAKGAEELIDKSLFNNEKKDKGVILESQGNMVKDFIYIMKGHRIWDREKARKVAV